MSGAHRLAVLNSPGYGVIIGPNSKNIAVTNSRFASGLASGIAVMHNTDNILISRNIIRDGLGGSNQHAGILVSDRQKYSHIGGPNFLLIPRPFSDGTLVYHWAPEEPIYLRVNPPRHIYITSNEIRSNLSNGLYLDGATLTYVRGNYIIGNSKEGSCLDNGATANVFVENSLIGNGRRWGKSDRDLELDFVEVFGRMEDGTATAKLPGISLDNAAFNIVTDNHIAENSGSGIKLVRTSFYNLIGHNIISNNNTGKNRKFFFFGIEAGGAVADTPVTDLNFEPSVGNIIFQNVITGAHYAGIQFCFKCDYNEVFDNMIMNTLTWALEQTNPSGKNIFMNNFSLMPSRNANLNGQDGRTLIGGSGSFDFNP
jgi:parallel beta-helix repeat protein